MLTFTGEASAGQYSIYLMAEDWIPGPRISYMLDTSPLSSVPVHLSLTGESFVKKKKEKEKETLPFSSLLVKLQLSLLPVENFI